jgi:hypothetical protein
VFTVHAKQYEQARKSGLPAFSTPKHILAAGHRLVRLSSFISLLLAKSTDETLVLIACAFHDRFWEDNDNLKRVVVVSKWVLDLLLKKSQRILSRQK